MRDTKRYHWEYLGVQARNLKPQDRIEETATSTAVLVVIGRPKINGGEVTVVTRKGNRLNEVFGERTTRTYGANEWLYVYRLDKNLTCPECGKPFETTALRRHHQIAEGHALGGDPHDV
ncbi:hypothetical protein [Streptomyces hoynatensis]|uniref:hypothetical protein n=1 Tax=Streptomyces hoynatensis TaxID=1141874 RepID=UPI0011C3BF44|nr:hypothetical protein [Streptomyces hoynatensis]